MVEETGSTLSGIGNLLAGAGSFVDTLAGNTIGAIQNHWNLQQQQAALDWQKSAQETTWQREDNAVQRRAADLEAAGLSKTLAAGNGASASAPMTPQVPQSNFQYKAGLADMVQNFLSAQKQSADIDLLRAEKLKVQQEQRESEARTLNLGYDGSLKQNELALFELRKLGMERDNLIKYKVAAHTQAEKDLIQKKIDNYDLEIESKQLANDYQNMMNANFLRDMVIAINRGVSTKDLGTQGMFNELLKIAKGAGNKIDFWGNDMWLPGLHKQYQVFKEKK